MRVLGLDLAANTSGWAVLGEDATLLGGGSFTTPRSKGTNENRAVYLRRKGLRFLEHLHGLVLEFKPTVIGYEHSDWIKKNPLAEHNIMKALGVIEGILVGHMLGGCVVGCPELYAVGVKEAKLELGGARNSRKSSVRLRVEQLYPNFEGWTDDVSDAVSIARVVLGRMTDAAR